MRSVKNENTLHWPSANILLSIEMAFIVSGSLQMAQTQITRTASAVANDNTATLRSQAYHRDKCTNTLQLQIQKIWTHDEVGCECFTAQKNKAGGCAHLPPKRESQWTDYSRYRKTSGEVNREDHIGCRSYQTGCSGAMHGFLPIPTSLTDGNGFSEKRCCRFET